MKINKEFVNKLSERKISEIGDIIKEMNFLKIENGSIMNLNEKRIYKKLEEIFYTVNFLKKEGFAVFEEYISKSSPDINISNFSEDLRKISYINELMKEYWYKNIKIGPFFYNFIENNYKTDTQKERKINFWLPIGIAIFGLFDNILNNIFFIPGSTKTSSFLGLLFLIVVIIFGSIILWLARERNGVDVMFFNTTLAIIILFMVGLLGNDYWKEIVYGLSAVAIGTGIAGVFKK